MTRWRCCSLCVAENLLLAPIPKLTAVLVADRLAVWVVACITGSDSVFTWSARATCSVRAIGATWNDSNKARDDRSLSDKGSRRERKRVLALAQERRIDAVLVTELSRWGHSTQDLLGTLHRLAGWGVSLVAMSGMTFEVNTPHGKMLATLLAGIAEFERDLISERVKSGLAAARARGKKLGRQPGQRPKSDRLAPRVLRLVGEGRSYRWIAREVQISKTTVEGIVKRARGSG